MSSKDKNAVPAQKKNIPLLAKVLSQSRWWGVLSYTSGLIKNVALGKESFKAAAAAAPRDSVAKLFAMVWPSSRSANRSQLLLLFALGLGKVVLLSKSMKYSRLLAQAVQSKNSAGFKQAAKGTLLVALLGAISSALAQWAETNVAITWRDQIVSEIHSKYYELNNYYSLQNLKGREAIVDPEERLSREAASVTRRLAKIIGLLFRSVPSLVFFTLKLGRTKGWRYAVYPLLYYGIAYEVAQRLFPKNIGELYRGQARAVGGFNQAVSRVATHGEAIAALDGAEAEKHVVLKKFSYVSSALSALFRATATFGVVFKLAYQFIPRAFMASMILSPFFDEGAAGASTSELVGEFRYTFMMMLEMLVSNGDVLTISAQHVQMQGVSYRVVSLLKTLEKLSAGTKQKRTATFVDNDEEIKFEHVEVKTPTNVELVHDLTFSIPHKDGKLLLTGQNGAGKSSIFRCLGGLWESEGTINKPQRANIFYLPQKPYLPQGDIATLISYPFSSSNLSEEQLKTLLTSVDLAHLINEKGTNTNWEAKLSLGESQRLALARLFFHKPKFAVIDEATSACSMKVEEMLYSRCEELDIAYITICHRPALKQYHNKNLNLTGVDGGYEISDIDQEAYRAQHKRPARDELSMRSLESGVANDEAELLKRRSEKYHAGKRALPQKGVLGQLKQIFGIVLPKSYMKLSMFLTFIGLRTVSFHIYSRISGYLLNSAITRNRDNFRKALLLHFGIDVLSGLIEEGCVVLQNDITVIWSENLTRYLLDLYFQNNSFYNAKSIDGRIPDLDQRILETQELAENISSVFAASLTPMIDLAFFGRSIYNAIGTKGLTPLVSYAALSSVVLSVASPNHKYFNLKEKELESKYKTSQIRLKTHAESIAFLGGGEFEQNYANDCMKQLVQHLQAQNSTNSVFKSILYFIYMDVNSFSSIVTVPKVLTSFLQLVTTQRAGPGEDGAAVAARNVYISSASDRMLTAAGKLSNVFENLSSIMSSSTRITEMIDVLHQIKRSGKFDKVDDASRANVHSVTMEHVDVVTPNGMCLLKDLSIEIEANKSLCVTGVNGSGKTSFFRVLANLWPLRGDQAKVTAPSLKMMSLIPQKQYSYQGTLAQQVTYPHTGKYDETKVIEALNKAGIGYLVDRYDKRLEMVLPWEDTLSLGEQQRMSFARLYYQLPKFCVLDECSDAVSVDQEEKLYKGLEELGITCITISKRLVLPNFHQKELKCGVANEKGFEILDL